MKKYYDLLTQFTNGSEVSKLHLLNTGKLLNKNMYSDEDFKVLEEDLHFIKMIRVNSYGDPVYIITEAGKQYRDN